MKTYRAIINGKEKRLTKEELDYVKRIYGDWEYVYIFNSPDFFTIKDMSNILEYKNNTVYVKHLRNPERYPLEENNGVKGVYIDTLFKYWLK